MSSTCKDLRGGEKNKGHGLAPGDGAYEYEKVRRVRPLMQSYIGTFHNIFMKFNIQSVVEGFIQFILPAHSQHSQQPSMILYIRGEGVAPPRAPPHTLHLHMNLILPAREGISEEIRGKQID